MQKIKSCIVFCCLTVFAFILCSCASSLRYSSTGIDRPEFGSKPLRIVAVDLIDSRQNNPPIVHENMTDDLTEIRMSVREHMVNAGIIQSQADVVAAPASLQEIETILSTANKQGADAVLFLRLNNISIHGRVAKGVSVVFAISAGLTPVGGIGLLPLIVAASIPVNEEGAHVVVEAMLIDPKTRVLLGHFIEKEDFDDKVTAWSHDPLGKFLNITKNAIQKALVAVADSSKAGFPGRRKKVSLNTILTTADIIQFHPDTNLTKASQTQKE